MIVVVAVAWLILSLPVAWLVCGAIRIAEERKPRPTRHRVPADARAGLS